MPIAARHSPPPEPKGRPDSQILPAQAPRDTSAVRSKVLSYIRSKGGEGATCEEVELAVFMAHQTCSARIKELRDHPQHGGQIEILKIDGKPIKRPTVSGRSAYVYVTTQHGELP